MDWGATLCVILAAAAGAVFAGWRGARPPDLLRGPRLIPWRFLMVIAACIAVFGLVHVVNLLGFETGRR